MSLPEYRTLVEMIADVAQHTELAAHVYDRRGKSADVRSYADMCRAAEGWARWLAAEGVAAGDRVALCLPTSHALLGAFFGAVLAGAEPFLLAQPRAMGGEAVFTRRMGLLAGHLRLKLLITSEWVGRSLAEQDLPDELARIVRTDPEPPPATFDAGRAEDVDPESICHLQLTSGSTALPKAVRLTHRAVMCNMREMFANSELPGYEPFVSWLPMYHDMGLIGGVLCQLYMPKHMHLMSPATFVARPTRWLELMSQTGAAVSHAPPFALRMAAPKIDPTKLDIDLSSWRMSCVGAEHVPEQVVETFNTLLASKGLQATTLAPSYGMAETVLGITIPKWHEPSVFETFDEETLRYSGSARRLADLGPVIDGLEMEIRTTEGEVVTDGREGVVWVRGPSMCSGYTDPEATAAAFDEEGWFDTGDLGVVRDGRLFLSGRVKDLIILDGLNIAPEELELVSRDIIGYTDGKAGAFSTEIDEAEAPILIAEVSDDQEAADLPALAREIGTEVAKQFAPLADLLLVRRGTLPQTSSGKVQRRLLKRLYETGQLPHLFRSRDA